MWWSGTVKTMRLRYGTGLERSVPEAGTHTGKRNPT